jgi:acetyl-CoA synthetase
MLAETAIAVLALGRLRAVFTPIFSGYAAPAVAARLNAFAATHLITADGFYRRGSVIPLKASADVAVGAAPSVRTVVVVRRLGRTVPALAMERDRDVEWTADRATSPAAVAETGQCRHGARRRMVIYTSGTTGELKGTVHVHGGFDQGCLRTRHTFDLRSRRRAMAGSPTSAG